MASDQQANQFGVIGPGDTLVVHFDEPMNTPTAGATITLCDDQNKNGVFGPPGGDSADSCGDLIDGNNSTFSLDSSETVLTITVSLPPLTSQTGNMPGIHYPAQAIFSSSLTDKDEGLKWDITGSTAASKTFP